MWPNERSLGGLLGLWADRCLLESGDNRLGELEVHRLMPDVFPLLIPFKFVFCNLEESFTWEILGSMTWTCASHAAWILFLSHVDGHYAFLRWLLSYLHCVKS